MNLKRLLVLEPKKCHINEKGDGSGEKTLLGVFRQRGTWVPPINERNKYSYE